MKKILFIAILFCSVSASGQGVGFKPQAPRFNLVGMEVDGWMPIIYYTKIFAQYEWVAGAFDSGLHVPQYNGMPSGVRTRVWQADGAVAVDTSNHRLYFYSGGNWLYSTASTGGGSVPISSLTAAIGTNSISNGAFGQEWYWNSLANSYGLSLASINTTSTGSTQVLFQVANSGANASSGQTTKSAIFTNGHTGTSSTNIAAQFEATSGTNNYAIIVPASGGRVGIGTSTPSYAVDIRTPSEERGLSVLSTSSTNDHIGVYGSMSHASATNQIGVYGSISTNGGGKGVYGFAGQSGSYGVYAENNSVSGATGIALYATKTGAATTNIAAQFQASGGTTNNALNIAAGAIALNGSAGTTGQVLTSAGANTLPTWSTPSGGTPAGNFGNIQLNRNGAFATPGSDSLDFESATGLTVKGNITSSTLTSGRVPYITTGGLLTDNADMQYNNALKAFSIGASSGDGEVRSYQDASNFISLKTNTGTNKSGIFRSNTDFFIYYNTSTGNTQLDATFAGSSILFDIQGTTKANLNNNGRLFVGGSTSATALLHLAAGTASASTAPAKLTTGTSLTVAEAGAIEYTTPQLFFTNGAAVRQELFQGQQSRVSTQYDNTTTTLGNVTGLTANLAAGKIYRFEAILYTTSNVAGGIKVAIANSGTTTSVIYEALTTDAGVITQGRTTTMGTAVAGVTAVTAANVKITGLVVANSAGTLTVQAAANAAVGTTSVLVGSTFFIIEML